MANPSREFGSGLAAGFKAAGHNIASVGNSVLLTGAYIIGIGSAAIVAKIVGKRFLDTEWPSKRSTHWVDHVVKKESVDKHKRMF